MKSILVNPVTMYNSFLSHTNTHTRTNTQLTKLEIAEILAFCYALSRVHQTESW